MTQEFVQDYSFGALPQKSKGKLHTQAATTSSTNGQHRMTNQLTPLSQHGPDNPIGLVLSGGGARGAFQVGVWEVLLNDPRGLGSPPEVISGTSAGALNGSFIAAGLSPKEMLDFWLGLADEPPVTANEPFFTSLLSALQALTLKEPWRQPKRRWRELRTAFRMFRKHAWYKPSGMGAMLLEYLMTARFDTLSHVLENIKTSYLFDTAPFRERLRKALGVSAIPRTKVKLAINTVDIRTGQILRIVNHMPQKRNKQAMQNYRYEPNISLDMLLASCSIPLLFNPIQIGKLNLWDGGVLVNTALAPTVSLGAKRIVPVLVTLPELDEKDEILTTFGSAVERLADAFLENAYNVDRKLLIERNTLARWVPELDLTVVELYEPIRPSFGHIFNAGSYLYFERDAMLAMYEAGKRATRQWLENGPHQDQSDLERATLAHHFGRTTD